MPSSELSRSTFHADEVLDLPERPEHFFQVLRQRVRVDLVVQVVDVPGIVSHVKVSWELD